MADNAGGYAGVKIDYGGGSVSEALNIGAQMNERRNEKRDALAAQKARQNQENTWANYQQVQDIGKDFKTLPQRLQDFSNGYIQDLQKQLEQPDYLNMDKAMLGMIIQNKVGEFAQWHKQAETAANAYDENFKRWSGVNSNVPPNQAYEWGAGQFANDFLTYDKDGGNITFQNPSLIRQRDYVNGNPNDPNEQSLSHPDVIGQFDVDMSPLSKSISGLEKIPVGDKQYVSKRGYVHATNWSGIGTNFSNPVEDASGNISGLELGYDTIPGTNIKVTTPAFKQATINSPQAGNAYARMRYLTRQHLESKGAPADDNTVNYMTDNAYHQFASSLIPHDIKTSETTKAPMTKNVFNLGGKEVDINDVYSEINHKTEFDLNGNPRTHKNLANPAVPFNELSSTAQSLVLKTAQDITNDNTLSQADIFVEKKPDGRLYIINHGDNNKVIAPIDFKDVNIPLNKTAKEKQKVLQENNAKQPQPATGKKKASATDYGL